MPNVKKVKIGSQELVREAMRELRAWQQDKTKPRSCPHCGAEGLQIIDLSAPAFAELVCLQVGGVRARRRAANPVGLAPAAELTGEKHADLS